MLVYILADLTEKDGKVLGAFRSREALTAVLCPWARRTIEPISKLIDRAERSEVPVLVTGFFDEPAIYTIRVS